MLTRRTLLGTALAATLTGPAAARATLGEDGLYHLDWYLEAAGGGLDKAVRKRLLTGEDSDEVLAMIPDLFGTDWRQAA